MLASQSGASTSSWIVAGNRYSRVEMGNNFNGFYYRVSHDNKSMWLNHGYGGKNLKRSSLYSSEFHAQGQWHSKNFHVRSLQAAWDTKSNCVTSWCQV